MDQLVFQHLQNHIETTMSMGENCANDLAAASEIFTQALLTGQTIYSCGHRETAPLWILILIVQIMARIQSLLSTF